MPADLWNIQDLNEYIIDNNTSMRVLEQLERNKYIKFYYAGICSTILEVFTKLDELFVLWDKHSGDFDYPIPSPLCGISPGSYYAITNNKWSNDEYGQNRKELNQFCIDYLKEALK